MTTSVWRYDFPTILQSTHVICGWWALKWPVQRLNEYTPRGGVARSCGSSVFSFLRYLHTVFHCGRASLQSHQQCNVIPFLHNCSSICYKGIKKMWYIHTKEYYSAIKKNEIISFSAIWMQLEIIILSQGSQKEKDKYCGPSTYMWNLKYSTNEPIYK